jgi:hypothetical protein
MRVTALSVMLWIISAGIGVSQTFDTSHLKIRVGRPLVARPDDGKNNTADSPLNEIKLGTNSYLALTAKNTTNQLTVVTPWSLGLSAPEITVLGPVSGTPYYSCGQWIHDNAVSGASILGFVHWETSCWYSKPASPTHKSMGLAVSTNSGQSWTDQGQIIAEPNDSTDQCKTYDTSNPACLGETGQGDCTAISDGTYYYLYCLNSSNRNTFVARAPISNPNSGSWFKFYQNSWSNSSAAGLGGAFTALTSDLASNNIGQSAGVWNGSALLIGAEHFTVAGGLLLSFSNMPGSYPGTTTPLFRSIPEPLLHMDAYNYPGPTAEDLIAYPSAFNNVDVTKNLGNHFLLSYTFVESSNEPHHAGRSIIIRDIYFTLETTAQSPQVGVALSRWVSSANNARISSTQVPPQLDFASPTYELDTGYVMTKAPSQANNKIVECVNPTWPSSSAPDHLLAVNSCDVNYLQSRTAGWTYQSSQPNTVEVYRCKNGGNSSHFASTDSLCEGLGVKEFSLGFALAN